jgi:two-component system, OmpR family, phosphate regulon sensor histidine kinase PhoR
MLAVIVVLFAVITALQVVFDDLKEGIAVLYAIPIAIVAIRYSRVAAVAAAGAAFLLFVGETLLLDQSVGPIGYLTRAILFGGVALVVHELSRRSTQAGAVERQATERLHRVIDTTHEAYVAMDEAGTITAWNREAEKLFGWPEREALGRTVEETLVPERLRSQHRNGLDQYLRTGEGPVLDHRLALPALRRDGSEIHVELTISPLEEEGRRSFHAFLHDISERQAAEELKSQFFALVSHELRTPLTSIIGYAEMVDEIERDDMSREGREYMGIIKRSAEKLDRLVQDLLLVAQVEAGTFAVEPKPTELGPVVSECVDGSRPAAEEAGIRLSHDADEVPTLMADSSRLGQVIDNLVSNAIKFTDRGGTVAVRIRADGDRCAIEVSDDGVGIEPAEQEHLFDRFYRAGEARKGHYTGAGLGLAISKAIVDAHEGEIQVVSEPGQGTTFRVLLPVHRAERRSPEDERARSVG